MEEKKKLSEQEFELLQAIKKESIEIATTMGELTYQKCTLDLQFEEQKNRLKSHKEKESIFFQTVREKYGNITLNIDTGDIS